MVIFLPQSSSLGASYFYAFLSYFALKVVYKQQVLTPRSPLKLAPGAPIAPLPPGRYADGDCVTSKFSDERPNGRIKPSTRFAQSPSFYFHISDLKALLFL
ncbi:hypothetical protein AVEN_229433-1 [Araneus ventricosus]|uniref:Uncharacterized protein n=1 Tax=Araneus ventricosus TaxID=182803 RepID=A0A4Y2TY90_ARAVE|nr:hypothetical protein AVEN_229433-1 [Araneus ventricosus]